MAEVEQSLHDFTDCLSDEVAATDAAGALVVVLPYLGRALGLQGLACLATSSRQLRGECVEVAKQSAHVLLLKAMSPVKPLETFKQRAGSSSRSSSSCRHTTTITSGSVSAASAMAGARGT
jgi:hypothetical protein